MATGRIGTTPVLQVRWSKAPTNGTTSLSGLDDNSVSLVYSVGYEAVYRNGVLLSRGNDYTATNGTTVTLIDATITGDIIEIFANQTVPLSDTFSQTVADGRFIKNTLTTTTGDIIYASGANTPARLGIGSSAQVLTVSGGIPAWTTPAGGGKVLQVVSTKYSTQTTVASGSLTDTGLTLSITPSAASSKVLVLITQQATLERLAANEGAAIELRRDSTTVYALGDGSVSYGYSIQATGATIVQRASAITISYLDAPNTTSSVTYKTRGCVSNTSNSGQIRFQDANLDSTITLLEIGA